MLLGMLGSGHLNAAFSATEFGHASVAGLALALGLIVLLEANAIFGKLGPMTTVKGVIHMSMLLTVAIWALLNFV